MFLLNIVAFLNVYNMGVGSDIGIKYRKKRAVEVEPIFGNIKQNKKFKRFLLRGIDKVKTEIGLIAIAHNLMKFSLAIV